MSSLGRVSCFLLVFQQRMKERHALLPDHNCISMAVESKHCWFFSHSLADTSLCDGKRNEEKRETSLSLQFPERMPQVASTGATSVCATRLSEADLALRANRATNGAAEKLKREEHHGFHAGCPSRFMVSPPRRTHAALPDVARATYSPHLEC